MEQVNKIIRSTDFDALSCRVSAYTKGYIQDQYLPNILNGLEKFLKYEYKLSSKRIFKSIVSSGNKLPVINRGTYIRTKSIDLVIERFLKKFESGKRRIINLGAGSDTRAFNVLSHNNDLEYVEIDFESSTKLKSALIRTDKELCKIVGVKLETPENLENFYNSAEKSLILPNYKLLDIDLRNTMHLKEIFKQTFDPNVPTLVISECMLCYTESKDSTKLIETIQGFFNRTSLLIYDPIGGTSTFGTIMIDNLKIRNISMPSLLEFNTLEKYTQRLHELGFSNVSGSNMFSILTTWIPSYEQARVSKLEFLDEIEELKLLLEHYCLFVATSGFNWSDIDLKFDLKI